MPKPPVVFYGSDAIALPSLDFFLREASSSCELVGVITQPDRPSGRGKKMRSNPVKVWAGENGIKILDPAKPLEPEVTWLRQEGVVLAMVMAYGHILSSALLDAPDAGTYNLHGSVLPAYRGASPVETALAQGEKETGATLMRVVSRMDAGPIVDTEITPIAADDDGPRLREKLSVACVPLLRRNLSALLAGEATETPQDEKAATYCRKLRKSDGALDFYSPAAVLVRRVSAFRGWPGSWFEVQGVRVKVGSVKVVESCGEIVPGQVILPSPREVAIGTTEGALSLLELQRPGGRMMPTAEFLSGFPLSEGEFVASQTLSELLLS
jgi:methionyl-tRNA formyltransferase